MGHAAQQCDMKSGAEVSDLQSKCSLVLCVRTSGTDNVRFSRGSTDNVRSSRGSTDNVRNCRGSTDNVRFSQGDVRLVVGVAGMELRLWWNRCLGNIRRGFRSNEFW